MNSLVDSMLRKVVSGELLTEADAMALSKLTGSELYDLFSAANRVRDMFVGTSVTCCSIINAKSGRCPEDCAFCAQSAHHDTDAPEYPLISEQRLVAAAKVAARTGSSCFGIVTSGTSLEGQQELASIGAALTAIRRETSVLPSCSLGIIDLETALFLKNAGAVTYHHNLETAQSYFPAICTTHEYEDDVSTIKFAKQAGLTVCSGGIFGLGENVAHRIELALTLRELEVDSIPINFLNPIPGTKLEHADFITPLECLQTIALYRLILPTAHIRVCGGRERNLRDLQSWIFFAGANGMMIGNYLTTSGRSEQQDLQMLKDLGMTLEHHGGCGNEQ